jgi:hypothetical protein
VWLVFLAVVLAAATAHADVVHTKDGRQLEGEVSEEAAGVKIVMRNGITLWVKKDEVASIDRKLTPGKEYEQRRAALAEDDLEGHEALANWCKEKGLGEQAKSEFLLVYALKVKAVAEPSVETEMALGAWAREHGLEAQAGRHLRAAYQMRAAALKEGDALGHASLAEWCYQQGLEEEGYTHLRRAYENDISLEKVKSVFDRLQVAFYSGSPVQGAVVLEEYTPIWHGADNTPPLFALKLAFHPLGARQVVFTPAQFSLVVNGEQLKCTGLRAELGLASQIKITFPQGGQEWITVEPVFEGHKLTGKELVGTLTIQGRRTIRFKRTPDGSLE